MTRHSLIRSPARLLVAIAALAAIVIGVLRIEAPGRGIETTHVTVDGTPVTVRVPDGASSAPAIVITHGFAGSRQLMDPIAVSLARNGYVAVSFDFLGHGRNPRPLTGDVTTEDGATAALLGELARVTDLARSLPASDGRVGLVGHSMASDIIVRAARGDPDIGASVAISLFSREVTAAEPRNLLIVVGGWEEFLGDEALRTLRLSAGPDAVEGQTYGDPALGTARRFVNADNVEHVGVLYSPETLAETVAWFDHVFGRTSDGPVDARGPWIALLLAGVVALGWPLAMLLPKIARRQPPQPRSTRTVLAIAVGPALLTPMILWPLEADLLPVLVAGYLATHFLVYGALTGTALVLVGGARPGIPGKRLALCVLATTLFAIFAIGLPLDRYVASFMPHEGRLAVMAALTLGTVVYTLADEWLVRMPGAPGWLPVLTKVCMLTSLGIAIAMDMSALFFLIIIFPVIILFFVIYGLFSGWIHRATGHPSVAGLATGIAFGWALGVTFPMLAG